ncbi:hypothetical protein Cagg_0373 [Chloroflexus aggregans DSM 9485]|uniref:Uncharacterized protein n=1 Tax=Chloroflexus aggregans (strain MD-66 / DSM 9485) TaxID=326427 RepID=B8G315_CHLAD|nr:hypothetical protein Cagg_0373 [Chloroflexus aggregans DSM 9485]
MICDSLRPFALRGARHRRAPTGGGLCVLGAFALTLCAFAFFALNPVDGEQPRIVGH